MDRTPYLGGRLGHFGDFRRLSGEVVNCFEPSIAHPYSPVKKRVTVFFIAVVQFTCNSFSSPIR